MKELAIVKIVFKDGDVGYFKNYDSITADESEARMMSIEYAKGLAEGLNFAIQTYEDAETDHAEVVVL